MGGKNDTSTENRVKTEKESSHYISISNTNTFVVELDFFFFTKTRSKSMGEMFVVVCGGIAGNGHGDKIRGRDVTFLRSV